MISVSSKSRTISSGASSWRRPARRRGAFRGETPAEDLLSNIEADFSGEEEIYPGAQRHGLRLRFLPRQAKANAYADAIDDGVRDTHLQRKLKDHPTT